MTKQRTFVYPALTAEVVVSSEATIAVVTGTIEGETYTWEGTAKRFPGDKWVRKIGIQLAMSRALQRAAKQLAKQGNGAVKNIDDNASRPRVPAPKFHTVKTGRRRTTATRTPAVKATTSSN